MCINDVLVAIEGKPCSGLSSETVSCLLAGPRGSFIKVRVQRDRLQHDLILRRDFALGQTGVPIISPESVPHAGPQPPEHAYSMRPKLRGILKVSDDDVLFQSSGVWTDSGSVCSNTGRRAFKISASNVLNGTARERASTSSKPLHTATPATSASHSVRSETRGSTKTTESASVMASASAPGLVRLGPLLRSVTAQPHTAVTSAPESQRQELRRIVSEIESELADMAANPVQGVKGLGQELLTPSIHTPSRSVKKGEPTLPDSSSVSSAANVMAAALGVKTPKAKTPKSARRNKTPKSAGKNVRARQDSRAREDLLVVSPVLMKTPRKGIKTVGTLTIGLKTLIHEDLQS